MVQRYGIFAALVQHTFAQCAGPVLLPVTDVNLSNGHHMRGIPFTVGTPPQNISFMPHDYLNDTWIYNSTDAYCPNGFPSQSPFCITYRGGQYRVAASSTAKSANGVYASGGDPSDAQRALGTHMWNAGWVNDVVALANISLPDFPIGMPDEDFGQQFDTQNNIGIGVNSTLLTALLSAGHIAGRSWSWWWGQNGATSDVEMDGSIVFGGYDQAKTTGNGWTQPLQLPSEACPSGMIVTITNLLLNFPNGTQASMTEPNIISACLQPDFTLVMTILQTPYYDRFAFFTNTTSLGSGGGNGIGAGGQIYAQSDVFDGSITVELNDGAFTVEIPNDILAVPPQQITSSGSMSTNLSTVEILIGPTGGVNENDIAILGRQFFSLAYLNVNFDAGTFTLWKANPTEDTNLVALGSSCSAAKSSPSPTQTANGPEHTSGAGHDGQNGQAATSHSSHPQGSNFSTATIAGIAVGSALGLVAIAVFGVLCCMRRRRQHQASAVREYAAEQSERRDTPYFIDQHGVKMHEAFSSEMHELRASRDPRELVSEARIWELQHKSVRNTQRFDANPNNPSELP